MIQETLSTTITRRKTCRRSNRLRRLTIVWIYWLRTINVKVIVAPSSTIPSSTGMLEAVQSISLRADRGWRDSIPGSNVLLGEESDNFTVPNGDTFSTTCSFWNVLPAMLFEDVNLARQVQ